MLLFGPLYKRYSSPSDFLRLFAVDASVIGGIFAEGSQYPELLITRKNGELFIFENFTLARRVMNNLPVQVYEVTEEVLSASNFRDVSHPARRQLITQPA